MAQTQSWQAMIQKEHFEKVIENVSEIPRPPYFPPLAMSSDPGTLGIRWENWIDRFDNFIEALDIQNEAVKRAMLFYYVGDEVCQIFATLPMTGGEKDYELAKNRLTEYFVPMQDNVYETHIFRKLTQEKGETIQQYEARLREYASRCHFDDIDKQIKSRLILTCNQTRLRRRAQKEPSLTLQDILAIGRAIELEQTQEKKKAEDEARKSVTSLRSAHSSKGELDVSASKTKCWGKLFKSCAGKDLVEESDEESDGQREEPEEEVKVVLLEMTPQMRRIRALKKSKSMPEGSTPYVEPKDDIDKPLLDDEPVKPGSQHRHSVDVLTTGGTNVKKPRAAKKKAREGSKSPAKSKAGSEKVPVQGEGDNKSPMRKAQEGSQRPQKQKRQGSKSRSPSGRRKEPACPAKQIPEEAKKLIDSDQGEVASHVTNEVREPPSSPHQKQEIRTKKEEDQSPRPSKEEKEGSCSPKKKRENPKVKEERKSPVSVKEQENSNDSNVKKGRRRRKSKDKGSDDKKGILKKEPIEITITAPEESQEVVSGDGSEEWRVGKRTEKGDKHEKVKVTFSKDTKEPVVGEYNPDNDNDPDEKDKNTDQACGGGATDPKQPEEGLAEKEDEMGSPKKKRKEERQRRPSKDLM